MAKGKIKVHSLTGRMTSKLVFEAWRAVRRNRGAAGIDKVSIQMFEQNLDANLDRLMRELKQGTFQPLPARRVYIPKDAKGTKFRPPDQRCASVPDPGSPRPGCARGAAASLEPDLRGQVSRSFVWLPAWTKLP